MLGNHELGTTVQLTNRFEDIGGAVTYLNRTHRWNWGFIVENTPYTIGQFEQAVVFDPQFGVVPCGPAVRIRQINRGVTGITQYPFSRAHRVEFAGGIRRISFDFERETFLYSFQSASSSTASRRNWNDLSR